MKKGSLQVIGMELERVYRGSTSTLCRDTYVGSTYSINKALSIILETIYFYLLVHYRQNLTKKLL
jgi:hypothetical protein